MNKWLSSTVETYIKYFGPKKFPVVYEVGSRDGEDGIELAQRISDGQVDFSNVVLIECNPPHIDAIKRNYPQAILVTEAISDKAGEVEFLQIHGDKNYMGSSSMDLNRTQYSWVKETSTIKVKTRTLESVIKELKHKEIDVMKIDIEGYSYEALKGMGIHLRDVKVYHIETEIEGVARNKSNLDIALFMENAGYKLVDISYEWPPNIEDHVYIRMDI